MGGRILKKSAILRVNAENEEAKKDFEEKESKKGKKKTAEPVTKQRELLRGGVAGGYQYAVRKMDNNFVPDKESVDKLMASLGGETSSSDSDLEDDSDSNTDSSS